MRRTLRPVQAIRSFAYRVPSVLTTHVAPHLRIQHFSALLPPHQQHLRRLAGLVSGTGRVDGKATFVACSVVSTAEPCGLSTSFCATGVNYALHRELNAGRTLRGILHGCAEQNALGVAAASGQRYGAIRAVYLYASPPADGGNCAETTQTSVRGAVFPCPECWRHLLDLAAIRHEDSGEPLQLFVYSCSTARAWRGASVAKEYMSSRPTSSIDVTIVLME